MGVEAGLCYNMGSVTAKPEWDIRLLSRCGCNYLRIALTLYPESHRGALSAMYQKAILQLEII